MDFMVARFQALPDHLHVQLIASPCDVIMGRLEAEADEMWSFVKQKTNRQWVWMAMDKHGVSANELHGCGRVILQIH